MTRAAGPVATILVRRGTPARRRTRWCAGTAFGRVRAMLDENGKRGRGRRPGPAGAGASACPPSPSAGDEVRAVADERDRPRDLPDAARGLASVRRPSPPRQAAPRLEDLFDQDPARASCHELHADHQGRRDGPRSRPSTTRWPDRVATRSGCGASTRRLAPSPRTTSAWPRRRTRRSSASSVRPDPGRRDLADREGVDIRLYSVIYQVVEDIEKALTRPARPRVRARRQTGDRRGPDAPSRCRGSAWSPGRCVTSGDDHLGGPRPGWSATACDRLRRAHRLAAPVQGRRPRGARSGYECGIGLDNFQDIHEGDQIEAYEMVEIPR